jgi:prepilin signal peptidase PulO-like enzyme (type II secretory pathway)
MIFILFVYFFLLGLIVGSFLNVVILRHNTGKTLGGRSACMSCKTQLTWKELIPVFSFLFQKGRCKTCKTKLNWQYPLVEFATGVLFATNFLFWIKNATSAYELLVGIGLTTCLISTLIIMYIYDVRHKIIPDQFSFTAWGISLLYVLLSSRIYSGISLFNYKTPHQVRGDILFVIHHILAGISFYVVVWLIWKLSKGRMIGLGDAKLLLSIGTILGFVYGLSSIFVAVWIAMIYVIHLLLKHNLSSKNKHITMKTEIPFGPFLILGFLIVYFTHIDVTSISLLFENFS